MQRVKLLIAGASGLVGSNCQKYFRENTDVEVVGTHFSYPTADTSFLDTLDPENELNFDIDSFAPTHILHAGALTHVDHCETNQDESYTKTVSSTRNLLKVAERHKARFIYISTDYVFDGHDGPYLEDAPLNPLSVYGRHKLESEELVRGGAADHLILRITNVYGDEERNKNFIARMLDNFQNGKAMDMKLPVDQYATPVNARDIAKALYLLIKDNKSGTYHIASTDYLNRVQLAGKVAKHFSEELCKISAVTTAMLAQPAARPLQGGLKARKFLQEYPHFSFGSVDEYLYNKLNKGV